MIGVEIGNLILISINDIPGKIERIIRIIIRERLTSFVSGQSTSAVPWRDARNTNRFLDPLGLDLDDEGINHLRRGLNDRPGISQGDGLMECADDAL
jgi:hypothetical protein